jgi:hypothetical protein
MDFNASITNKAYIRRKTTIMLGNIKIRFIIKRGL